MSTHHGGFIQLPHNTRGSSLVPSMAKDELLLKFYSPGFSRTGKEKPKTVNPDTYWVLLLYTRCLESLYFEEFVVNVGVFFVKMLLIGKRNWTKSSLEIPEVLLHLLKPTTLKLTAFKQRPSEHYQSKCTHLTTDRTLSYCFTEIHKRFKSLLAGHWSLDDLGRGKVGRA